MTPQDIAAKLTPTQRDALAFALTQHIGDGFYLADNEYAATVNALHRRGLLDGYMRLSELGVEVARAVAS